MNSKLKMIIGVVAVALVSAGAAGGAMWWMNAQEAHAAPAEGKSAHAEPKKKEKSDKPVKYITLDKVIVMLKRGQNEATTHYLSTDLVLSTDEEREKEAKDHLPLLRSIVVRALSNHTMAEASSMSVEQYAAQLNKTFDANYAAEDREKPFDEVMIGKLIVE
ncbi:flagellar basal body protein [Massilia sp. Dwa41.01b]|uniref:flagellar basal body-associated FliL family protein n=1 Tax=unclassified Massilia TaxID=2609279 RepID=UPI001604000F|nr:MULTISPECIES: flagellar basal body-associated FliL family protein [unclassified Massilia]QNA88207.1 flagellar basal body protein [Massilia sp. Dwa41.01b]QNA99109.1 flagellar basal body protein [Massilia sp. Se16.2.3]